MADEFNFIWRQEMTQQQQRPLGVTILAVLAFLGGILNLFAGIGIVGLLPIYGLLLLILGAAALAFGFGAWTAKPWAWTLGIGLYALNVVLQFVFLIINWATIGSIIVPIVIAGVIIYYLMTPDVKKYFGRA